MLTCAVKMTLKLVASSTAQLTLQRTTTENWQNEHSQSLRLPKSVAVSVEVPNVRAHVHIPKRQVLSQ